MRQFRKNILRLAWKNKGAMAGSALIIAIGIFTMAAMFDTMFNRELFAPRMCCCQEAVSPSARR